MGKPQPKRQSTFFDIHYTIDQLATQQGVQPIIDIKQLAADFWPEDESVDEFIDTVRQWRREASTRVI
jgi:hypothetical protein